MVIEKFPQYIEQRITKEFLSTLKINLDIELKEYLDKFKKIPTFWNFYQWFDNSNGFNKALKNACALHNLNDLYTYRDSLELYDNEMLGGILMMMLYEKEIIQEGEFNDAMPCPFSSCT